MLFGVVFSDVSQIVICEKKDKSLIQGEIWCEIAKYGPDAEASTTHFTEPPEKQNQRSQILLSHQLYYPMEKPHFEIYPFLSQYPFLFCQPWTQIPLFSHLAPLSPPLPSNEVRTRESLSQLPQALKPQLRQMTRNEPASKPTKSKRAVAREKLLRRREREDNYQRKKQKKDRNLPSNILKHLTNLFHLHPQIIELTLRCIPRGAEVSPEALVQKFRQAVKMGQSYIRPASVQGLCKEGLLSKDEAQTFRIMLRWFLLLEMPVLVVGQSKIRRKQRLEYIKMGRKLLSQLINGTFP